MSDIAAANITVTQDFPQEIFGLPMGHSLMLPTLTFGNGSLTYPTYGVPVPALKEFRFPALQLQSHLRQREGGVGPHVTAGLLPLQDQPAHPAFQGQAQQPFVASNIDNFDPLFPETDGISRVAGGDGHEGGADCFDPGKLFLEVGIFGQGDETFARLAGMILDDCLQDFVVEQ